MPVHLKRVVNDVNGAAGVCTGNTASGRGGSKATQTVNMRKPCNDVNGVAGFRTGDTASGRGGSGATQTVNKRNPCKVKGVGLRIGSANVGTMNRRSEDVADMVVKRKLDFSCVQETRWKGGRAKLLKSESGKCKFYWSGSQAESESGVGVLVTLKWIQNVIEVRRVSDRIMG